MTGARRRRRPSTGGTTCSQASEGLPHALRKRAPPGAIEVIADGAPRIGARGAPLTCVAAMANDCADWSPSGGSGGSGGGGGNATLRRRRAANADVTWLACARDCHGAACGVYVHGMLCARAAGIPAGAEGCWTTATTTAPTSACRRTRRHDARRAAQRRQRCRAQR